MSNPANYVVQAKTGQNDISIPGVGHLLDAGQSVEITPSQYRQIKAATLARLNVLQAPTSLASKQDAATAATDAELAAGLAGKQDAATAATDAELAAARTAKVTKTSVALGTQTAGQSAFTYYEITNVCQRGLMSLLTITDDGAGKYDIDLRSASAGGGTQFLAATDADGTYDISVPVYVEGDGSASLWLGIKNKGVASRTFTLSALRVEKFA